jgi:hypothetical protein
MSSRLRVTLQTAAVLASATVSESAAAGEGWPSEGHGGAGAFSSSCLVATHPLLHHVGAAEISTVMAELRQLVALGTLIECQPDGSGGNHSMFRFARPQEMLYRYYELQATDARALHRAALGECERQLHAGTAWSLVGASPAERQRSNDYLLAVFWQLQRHALAAGDTVRAQQFSGVVSYFTAIVESVPR